ncbi:MAG: Holliday junction resolvase RuvX [Ardenticatenaceae bacterium]|nr:Holliday junction resolvase RuvX [Anaerolineales bacterium]MCB9008397.1 Holliday junction resolvase RuvX [Ardenticatenaceae bacterium]
MSSRYPGRVMALDLGSVRIGVAISDPTRTIAQSYGVVKRKSREEDFARYQQILAEQQVTLLVVGLPTTSEGGDSDTAVWIRNYMAEFSQQCDIPVEFWDESFTTVRAEESLRQRGKRGKKARQQVDAVAAAFILQSYLDAQRNVIE